MSTKSERICISIFIDALGWKILRRNSFLQDILPYQSPLQTVLGYSCTCDPTILTGNMPFEHGHLSFYNYAPVNSPFRFLKPLRWLPKSLTSRGRVRHCLSRLAKKALGYTGYFQLYNVPFEHLPLFDYSEKKDIYEPGGINGGQKTIFERLNNRSIQIHKSDWRRCEQDNIDSLSGALTRRKIRFAYLYLADLDAVMHEHGPDNNLVRAKLESYEKQIRALVTLAEANYEQVDLMLFSDHGMAEVDGILDLQTKANQLGLRFGEDFVCMYDSTMARFWFLSDSARSKITAMLSMEPSGLILSDDDLRGFGCLFPDRRYGDLFFLMNPGTLICPSFMGEKPIKGMHGYDPRHEDSVVSFATNVPLNRTPERLDDLAETILGLVPGNENGLQAIDGELSVLLLLDINQTFWAIS